MDTMSDFSDFNRRTKRKQHGFTLIEMTMVLVILSLLLGGLMAPMSTQLENNHRWETKRQLEKINEALLGYVLVHGYLPCPDTSNDGREERVSSGCFGQGVSDEKGGKGGKVWHGTLPWINLGVGKQDAWNSRFTYAVSERFTDARNTPLPAFSLETEGAIQVVHGVDRTPALVLSHGANLQGGMSIHGLARDMPTSLTELENSDGNARFEFAPYSNDSRQGFDDQMVWVSPYILKNRLLLAGRLKR